MGGQIWGTFSVKDHCRPNAFVREVLLFDRLVLPVPVTIRSGRDGASQMQMILRRRGTRSG